MASVAHEKDLINIIMYFAIHLRYFSYTCVHMISIAEISYEMFALDYM